MSIKNGRGGSRWERLSKDVVAVVIVENENVLVSTTRGNDKFACQIGVCFPGDGDKEGMNFVCTDVVLVRRGKKILVDVRWYGR